MKQTEAPPEIPKDLKLEITTKEGAQWEEFQKSTEAMIISGRRSLMINEHILEMTKKKVAEERAKLLKK